MVQVPLHWAVLPRCNREDDGASSEARFQLSDWLKKCRPNQTVTVSSDQPKDWTRTDRQNIADTASIYCSDTNEDHNVAIDALASRVAEA